MKIVVVILLFLTPLFSWAAGSIPTEQIEIKLYKGQEYQVAKPAIGGYAIIHDGLSSVRIENGKAIITSTGIGKSVVQILHTDGTISNYLVQGEYDKNSSGVNDKNALAKGYNLILSADYLRYESKTSAQTTQRSGWRGRAILTTKLGTNGKFYGMVEGRDEYPTYFYVQGDFKKLYYGYGDKNIPLNSYKPSFISQPRLRQHTAGWDGEKFDLDFWSGQNSPIPSFSSGISAYSNAINNYLISNEKDRFSGVHFNYKFKEDSIYGSYWYNHQNQRQIPYLGYTYNNYNLGISNSFTVGNLQEAPVFADMFTYESRNKSSWTLQRVQMNYERAESGYDTLLFTSKLPTERFSLLTQMYSGDKFSLKGSPYLNLGYARSVIGYTTNAIYSAGLGWQNSRVLVGVDGSTGLSEYTYAPGEYKSYSLSPKLEVWLNKPTATWRWKVGANQYFNHSEYANNGFNDRSESRLTVYTKHKSGLGLSLGVGRFTVQSPTNQRTGFNFIPRAEYRKAGLTFYAQGNISYVDKSYYNSVTVNEDGGLTLGQERYSAGLRYSLNQKHIFDARYVLAEDAISNRGYSYLSVGYTLKLGSQTKSIISLFDSKKVWGNIYDDKNLNGVQDKDEPGIKDLIVKVVSDRGSEDSTRTDSDGFYKISGLKDETYSLSIENNSGYTLSSSPGSLNFKNQEGFKNDLAAIKTKEVQLELKGNTEDLIMAVVNCDEKSRFNKSPIVVGQVTNITVPANNKCSISLELMGQSNMSILPEKISTNETNRMSFTATSSRILLGQLFWDKNANGLYDIGEEIVKQSVVFDKLQTNTDANGIFTAKISDKISRLKFIKVPGFRCTLRNAVINDFSPGKIYSIACQK